MNTYFTYFAHDPLHSYVDEPQKNAVYFLSTYFACDSLHSYFDEPQKIEFLN